MTSSSGVAGRSLPRAFYLQPTLRIARRLLGKILVHDTGRTLVAGRIVEVEAYRGPRDRAAHSYGGRRTARNESMYGEGGRAYVYLIYGLHHCVNVVCQGAGVPEAVLVRALEPVAGLPLMRRRRGRAGGAEGGASVRTPEGLCRGPGVLCRTLGIDRRQDGVDLTRSRLRILDAPEVPSREVARSARIGIDYAGVDAARPWRFYVSGHPSISGRPR